MALGLLRKAMGIKYSPETPASSGAVATYNWHKSVQSKQVVEKEKIFCAFSVSSKRVSDGSRPCSSVRCDSSAYMVW
jgi:hypothetical protein